MLPFLSKATTSTVLFVSSIVDLRTIAARAGFSLWGIFGGVTIIMSSIRASATTRTGREIDEETATVSNEELIDIINDEVGEVADEREETSIFGVSRATADLPVADEVRLPELPPTPELEAEIRRMEEEEEEEHRNNIQRAVPQETILQRKRQAERRRFLFASAWFLSVAVVGIVIGLTMGPSSSSSSGAQSPEPTPSPTSQQFLELQRLVVEASFDEGASLQDDDSPQYKALSWLENNTNLDDYPNWKLLQRYSLASFYYSTNGADWSENGGWLSDSDECSWFTEDDQTPACNDFGRYLQLTLLDNNLKGTLPMELVLLSDSLCMFVASAGTLSWCVAQQLVSLCRL